MAKKGRKLTDKQERYAIARAVGANQQSAARVAGYEDSMLPSITAKVENNGLVRHRIGELMDKAGMDDRYLLRTHRALIKQRKPIYYLGEKVDTAVDADIRLRALEMAYKIKGMYTPDLGAGVSINITIPGAVAKEAERTIIDVPAEVIPQDVVVEAGSEGSVKMEEEQKA